MNGDFGITPWGRDWVRLAEPTSLTRPDPALPRARSLARNDHVHDLTLSTGTAEATVEGRRVHVTVPTWTASQRLAATTVLTGAPPGEDLPDDMHTALRDADVPLVPTDATSTCDCSGRATRCRHILATCFEIARRLDERPATAITLRGGELAAPPTDPSRIWLSRINPSTFYGD